MMPFDVARRRQIAAAAAALLLLAGCAGDRMATGTALVAPQAGPARTPPPVDMGGRWMLSSSAGGACGMGFTSTPGASEGAIRPEGGCPGTFFTSRKWTFEGDALVLRNHNGEPLAQLRMASPGRFDGQSGSGQPVSLTR